MCTQCRIIHLSLNRIIVKHCAREVRYAYVHTDIHTYIHTYIHAYIHTYKHTCIHTYIHTNVDQYKLTGVLVVFIKEAIENDNLIVDVILHK